MADDSKKLPTSMPFKAMQGAKLGAAKQMVAKAKKPKLNLGNAMAFGQHLRNLGKKPMDKKKAILKELPKKVQPGTIRVIKSSIERKGGTKE